MQSLLRWGIENSTPQPQTQTQTQTHTQTPTQPQPQPQPLDPSIIDIILGKSDADRMKDALAIAVSADKVDVEERVNALDDLEMLIEQIDNANNLEKLNMWEPLHGLLTPPTPTPDTERIRTQAIWVIGTAVQNNPAAQDAYLNLNPIPLLTSFLAPPTPSHPTSKETRSKVIYALSGLLKHNAPALKQLDVKNAGDGDDINDGWDRLRQALQHPDNTVRRKTVFLLNNLLTPNEAPTPSLSSPSQNLHTPDSHSHPHSHPHPHSQPHPHPQDPIHPNSHSAYLSHPDRASTSGPTFEAMQTHGIVDVLVESLTGGGEDEEEDVDVDLDFEEKGVTLLRTYLQLNGPLNQSQKDRIRRWIVRSAATAGGESGNGGGDEAEGGGDSLDFESLAERWGMNVSEVEELVKKV
ncbi:nucleotide exchange factor Fes1-domain-containing protein [Lentinula boryana]|uniref:Nucleotide exchange factor Fes1-domain-containing protein n=1 Tax=Lentinula boryana TaxID=40481 RepID=A0ABQ8PZ66_9AGAR|nr:nucleotide exchange factor Fes1-domain-containing protein [Lentinula boryana]